MRRSSFVFVAGLLLLSSPTVQAQRGRNGEQEARQNGWIFSLSEGLAQARKTGKPLMVVLRCVP